MPKIGTYASFIMNSKKSKKNPTVDTFLINYSLACQKYQIKAKVCMPIGFGRKIHINISGRFLSFRCPYMLIGSPQTLDYYTIEYTNMTTLLLETFAKVYTHESVFLEKNL